jgi:putative flippase GtrA
MAYRDGASAVRASPGVARRSLRPSVPAALAQWIRFAVVGAGNTLRSWCVYAVLVRAGVPYLFASSLAFALGAMNSYALNRRWTFASGARRAPEVLRFAVVQGIGLGLNVCLLYALVHDARVHHLVAQVLVFPVASAVTFLLSRHWAFAAAKPVQA